IHERLLATIAPAQMAEALGWMMEALNLRELGALMGELQAKLPPPAFSGILELARQRLDERRWRQRWACRPLSAGKT
ncbi:MAG TPA: hypothetical protein VJN44_06060, partial [Roseateles sp.]|nr:hypothetical protein [Roseateles sp.]